jgi:hypothetical protein
VGGKGRGNSGLVGEVLGFLEALATLVSCLTGGCLASAASFFRFKEGILFLR